MDTVTRVIPRGSSKKKTKKIVIKWNGVKMLRNQSINACVDEIFETSKSMGFLKINLIGASSSGKTVLGSVLAHQLHTRDETFEVHHFEDKDLIDFKTTIQNLSRNNQILIFDDLSGLVANFGKKALDKLKAELTTVRHIDGNEDRKIIMILNFHSQKTLDKFLRISNFTFYTDCQLEEKGYLEELLGKREIKKIDLFAKLRSQSRMYHTFSFPLSQQHKDFFTYKDGNPFRVVLYNNGLSTRFVVSPQLKWILQGKLCQICDSEEPSLKSKINLDQFKIDVDRKFTKGIVKRAVELRLLRNGYYTQPKRVQQCEKYIARFFENKEINLEELAEAYGLSERTTRLFPDKQPEFEARDE